MHRQQSSPGQTSGSFLFPDNPSSRHLKEMHMGHEDRSGSRAWRSSTRAATPRSAST